MKIGGLGDWLRKLKKRVLGWEAHDRALVEISLLMALSVQRCFALAQNPDGTPWAPRQGNPRHRPLILTAKMLNAILASVKRPEVRDHRLTFRIPDDPQYAIYHQVGTRRMPARKYIGWSPDSLAAANKVAAKSYVDVVYKFVRVGL